MNELNEILDKEDLEHLRNRYFEMFYDFKKKFIEIIIKLTNRGIMIDWIRELAYTNKNNRNEVIDNKFNKCLKSIGIGNDHFTQNLTRKEIMPEKFNEIYSKKS